MRVERRKKSRCLHQLLKVLEESTPAPRCHVTVADSAFQGLKRRLQIVVGPEEHKRYLTTFQIISAPYYYVSSFTGFRRL